MWNARLGIVRPLETGEWPQITVAYGTRTSSEDGGPGTLTLGNHQQKSNGIPALDDIHNIGRQTGNTTTLRITGHRSPPPSSRMARFVTEPRFSPAPRLGGRRVLPAVAVGGW